MTPQPLKAELLLESGSAGSTDGKLHAVLQLHVVIAALAAQEHIDAVEPDDRRAMDAHEHVGIELFFERLHRLAHDIPPVANVELGVDTSGEDIVDVAYRHDADFAFALDRNALEVVV